jgi:hypothetical protein
MRIVPLIAEADRILWRHAIPVLGMSLPLFSGSAADLAVSDTELRIVLAPLSSPHRTRAIAALCEELNRTPGYFPGTRLRLHYAVAGPR